MTDELEPRAELKDGPLAEEEKANLLQVAHEAKLAALAAEGEAETVGDPNAGLPLFEVELLCPTPVAVRIAQYRAVDGNEAEVLHRKANGLLGSIAGGMRTTQLEA